MNITFDKTDNVNGIVTISLSEQDYADKVAQTLKDIRRNHTEKGYRPGHVPAALIEKKYGKGVKYDTINKAVSEALFNYIKENDIRVLGNPMPVAQEDFDIDAKDFTFKFNVGIAPEIDPHVDKDLKIPYYTIKVTDEMAAEQDANLRKRLGKQESGDTVEPDALVKGVITELNPDGTPKENGIVVENGIVAPKYFKSEEQKALFEGKHKGDTLTFNPAATCDANPTEMASMLGIEKEDTENHKGDFNFEINDIIVLRPAEHDQEFFDKIFGPDQVHNEEEYQKALRDMITQQLSADSNYRFTIDARDAILKAVGEIELPDAVLKEFLISQNENLNAENIDEEYDRIRQDLVWQLVREEIARRLEIKLSDDDLRNLAGTIARQQLAQYGMTNVPDDGLKYYVDNMLKDEKQREQIAQHALDMKLFNAIRATADTQNKEVSVDEFNALFAPEK